MNAKNIINLGKYLLKIQKKGTPLEIKFEIENIGIIDMPISREDPPQMWKEYIDLGGRNITINITIPNKSIEKRLRELDKPRSVRKLLKNTKDIY